MKTAYPYLKFNGNTEEVFNFYEKVFGVESSFKLRYGDMNDDSMPIDVKDQNKIAHVTLPLGDTNLMGSDVLEAFGPAVSMGNNFSITLAPDSADEAEKVFKGLSEGGKVLMPLQKEFWAEKYGMCVDKFGVQWMINYEGNVEL